MLVTSIPLKDMVVVTGEDVILIDTSNCKHMRIPMLTDNENQQSVHESYVEYIIKEDWWLEDMRSFHDMWVFGEMTW